MSTLKQLTRRTGPWPRGGQVARGHYRSNPHLLAFQVLFFGGLTLLAGLIGLMLHRVWGFGGGELLAVMAIPGGALQLGAGIFLWIRRPMIEAEMQRAIDEWPELEVALRATSQRRRRLARMLAERGYRTSTVRRAILSLWSQVQRGRSPRASARRVRVRESSPRPVPQSNEQLRNNAPTPGQPPQREQLTPYLVQPTAKLIGGGVVFFGAAFGIWLGWDVSSTRDLVITGLIGLCGLPFFMFGVADSSNYTSVQVEVGRALHEWPELERELRAAAEANRSPAVVLQQRGYRHYHVRRAIARCVSRRAGW